MQAARSILFGKECQISALWHVPTLIWDVENSVCACLVNAGLAKYQSAEAVVVTAARTEHLDVLVAFPDG